MQSTKVVRFGKSYIHTELGMGSCWTWDVLPVYEYTTATTTMTTTTTTTTTTTITTTTTTTTTTFSFWATVCKTINPMISDRCLSVCLLLTRALQKRLNRSKCRLGLECGLWWAQWTAIDGVQFPLEKGQFLGEKRYR